MDVRCGCLLGKAYLSHLPNYESDIQDIYSYLNIGFPRIKPLQLSTTLAFAMTLFSKQLGHYCATPI